MADLIQLMQYTLSQCDPDLPVDTKRVILKELLQAYTLDYLYNHAIYRGLNFYGGTCLHMIYQLNRLSEVIDLDNSVGIPLHTLEGDLLNHFRLTIGYADIETKTQIGMEGIHRVTLKFPLLYVLGLSTHSNEALHLKVEISPQKQIAVIHRTPILTFGKSFVAAHFSLETMMAGKMLACLERNFKHGGTGALIKGRDYYDLLWFMQQKTIPLEEKLAKDGQQIYTIKTALENISGRIQNMKPSDLAADLLPLFEQRAFIEAWLEGFKDNYKKFAQYYV